MTNNLPTKLRDYAHECRKIAGALAIPEDAPGIALIREAADEIERLQKRCGPVKDFEPSLNGLCTTLTGPDGIVRAYQAYSSKLGPEITVIAEATKPDGEVQAKVYGFIDLYSAQCHISGMSQSLALLLNAPMPVVKDTES
jgi:hypothetical protein